MWKRILLLFFIITLSHGTTLIIEGFNKPVDIRIIYGTYSESYSGQPPLEITPRYSTFSIQMSFDTKEGVREVYLENVSISNGTAVLRFTDGFEIPGSVYSYAVDPSSLSFDEGYLRVVAIGGRLYKCREWDYGRRTCTGKWEEEGDLKPEREYTVSFTPTDPAWKEEPLTTCHCIDCSSCTSKLNDPACTYVILDKDTVSSSTCIDNPSGFSGKTFDCQNHIIEYSGFLASAYGIYLYGKDNNVIRACTIKSFPAGGIEVDRGRNITMEALEIFSSPLSYGILLDGSREVVIKNSIITAKTGGLGGVSATNVRDVVIDRTSFSSLNRGLVVSSGISISLLNSVFKDLSIFGASFTDVETGEISNTSFNNTPTALSFYQSQKIDLRDVWIENAEEVGVLLKDSEYATVGSFGVVNITKAFIGVLIHNTTNSNISNAVFYENNKSGVMVNLSSDILIKGINATNIWNSVGDPALNMPAACNPSDENYTNIEAGVIICSSAHVDVKDAYVRGNGTCSGAGCLSNHNGMEVGILAYNSSFLTLYNITLRNAGDNFGFNIWECENVSIENSTVNGLNDAGERNTNDGVIGALSRNITIRGNVFFNNYEWNYFFTYVNDSIIENNTGYNASRVGIRIADSKRNVVRGNFIHHASEEGIRLEKSPTVGNVVENNTVTQSHNGIRVYPTGGNNIIRNNIVYNNDVQIYVSSNGDFIYNNIFNASAGQTVAVAYGSSYWNTTRNCSQPNIIGRPCIGGNWYSDYYGADDGSGSGPHQHAGDGIGDNPPQYEVGSGIYDYLPLTNNNSGYCTCGNCTECTDRLNAPHCTYVKLIQDVGPTPIFPACINNPQHASSKTFECAFHTVEQSGTGTSFGIYLSNIKNITVANCTFRYFTDSIRLENITNATFRNLTLDWPASYGVYGVNVSQLYLSGIHIANTPHTGIYFILSNNTTATTYIRDVFLGRLDTGIFASGAERKVIEGVEFLFPLSSFPKGIVVEYGDATVRDGTMEEVGIGLILRNITSAHVENLTINTTRSGATKGVEVINSSNAEIYYVYAKGLHYGVDIESSSNILLGNSSFNETYIGVYINKSHTISGGWVNITHARKSGVFFDNSSGSFHAPNVDIVYNSSDDPMGRGDGACDPNSTYYELFETGIQVCRSSNVMISKPSIVGNGTCDPDCKFNHNGMEAGILVYDSNNVIIDVAFLDNAGDNYGIYVGESRDVRITNSRINGTDPNNEKNTNDGIAVFNTTTSNISRNRVYSNDEWGIFLVYTNDSYVAQNEIKYVNITGIRLVGAANNTVENNTIEYVPYGVRLESDPDAGLWAYGNNILENTIRHITRGIHLGEKYYGFNVGDVVENNTIENNTVRDGSEGIYLDHYARSNMVIGNNFTNISYAVYIKGSPENRIIDNRIQNVSEGIYVAGAESNLIRDNLVKLAEIGLHLAFDGTTYAQLNVIQGNNITQNRQKGILLESGSKRNELYYNYICYNTEYDLFNNGSNSGENNTCSKFYNWQEFGHPGCTNTCSEVWQIFYGKVNGTLLLALSPSSIMYEWEWLGHGKVYVKNADVSIDWYQLYPLGRKTDRSPASSDFSELDDLLGTSPYLDSISQVYTVFGDGNTPLQTDNYTVFGRLLEYVPITDSLLGSSFKTGILWDGSDGGGEFSSAQNQDVVFFTVVNTSEYADYEVMVPAPLATYKGTSGTVELWLEID